jgi:hypothetical protein
MNARHWVPDSWKPQWCVGEEVGRSNEANQETVSLSGSAIRQCDQDREIRLYRASVKFSEPDLLCARLFA